MNLKLSAAFAALTICLGAFLMFQSCGQAGYYDDLGAAAVAQCSALTDQSSCEAAGDGYIIACLWAQAGGANACVPNYNFCAQLNADPALKGQTALLQAACTANANATVYSYSCIYHTEGDGSCGGDCRPPVVNCQNLTPTATNQCGEAGSLESFLCEYNSNNGCQTNNTNANAALAKCTAATADGSRSTCTETAITADSAYKCAWGGRQRGGTGGSGRRRR